MTTTAVGGPAKNTARRPVAGYILASIGVGVVGMVTAILITVSGIMNSFTEVSESYGDIFQTGTEIGPEPTSVELDDVKYTIVSFSPNPKTPSVADANQQCQIIDPDGNAVATNTSAQEITEADRVRFDRELEDIETVIYTHFEANSGTHSLSCQDFGLLSDGTSYQMGNTTFKGVLIGLGSVLIAGGLFIMGVVNSSRNKKTQAKNLRQPRQIDEA